MPAMACCAGTWGHHGSGAMPRTEPGDFFHLWLSFSSSSYFPGHQGERVSQMPMPTWLQNPVCLSIHPSICVFLGPSIHSEYVVRPYYVSGSSPSVRGLEVTEHNPSFKELASWWGPTTKKPLNNNSSL